MVSLNQPSDNHTLEKSLENFPVNSINRQNTDDQQNIEIDAPSEDLYALQKRQIYESMHPRRRKFVDRIGYDTWDPFQKPNDPLDLDNGSKEYNTRQLVVSFLQEVAKQKSYSNDYARGALECALGIINEEAKYLGAFDFCLWYQKFLENQKS